MAQQESALPSGAPSLVLLDALRDTVATAADQYAGGAASRFVAEVQAAVQSKFFVLDDGCGPENNGSDLLPASLPGALSEACYVETDFLWARSSETRVGMLFEREGYFSRGWEFPLLSVRFAVGGPGNPTVCPLRLIVEESAYSCERLSFADFERDRHLLVTAREANKAELHRMNTFIVQSVELYFRSIPGPHVKTVSAATPPYRQGVDGDPAPLRGLLAATSFEEWQPASGPLHRIVAKLHDHYKTWLLRYGPSLALRTLSALGRPDCLAQVAPAPLPPKHPPH